MKPLGQAFHLQYERTELGIPLGPFLGMKFVSASSFSGTATP